MNEDRLPPGLYIVATPIGNLGDLTPRAADVLRRADLVLAEDKRVTAKLLAHSGAKTRLANYNDHTNEAERARIVSQLGDQAIALVSDAGTPLISDPGYKLVRDARAAGHAVHTLPGPSAVIAALTLAGLPTDRFLFAGFLPSKAKARADAIAELQGFARHWCSTKAVRASRTPWPRLLMGLGSERRQSPARSASFTRRR